MSRRLWITDEVRDWLTDLRTRDPSAARLAGEAVIGLLDFSPGPPLVVPVDPLRWADDPATALDYAYQRQLVLLQKVRRATADVATARKRLDLNIQQLEASARKLHGQSRMADESGRHDLAQEADERRAGVEEALADLRREYPELLAEEEKALRVVRRLQRQAEDWRARKERVTLAYAAGQAQDTIDQALAEDGEQRGTYAHTTAARAAVETFLDTARGLEREHAEPPLALQELRLGALAEHDLRLLFGVEPSGAVLLLAAAEGPGGWHDQGRYIAEELFRGEPGREEETKESFLAAFFPDEAEERQAGAARLLARNRVRPLADVRLRRGFTLEQVAERMDATAEWVAAIEGGEPGVTDVDALAAYVEAIGGRLEIVADLGTERVNLR